jgi:hypothetical protein
MSTKIIGSNFPDAASEQLKPSKANYGANGYGGASSDTPSERTRAALTVNNDDTDPVLAAVRGYGTAAMRAPEVGDDIEDVKGTPATQIRAIGDGNVATKEGMRSRTANKETGPGDLGEKASPNPVRQP